METVSVVQDIVLEVGEKVRCRMLDVYTRESVFMDISFTPLERGVTEGVEIVPVGDVNTIHKIVSMFPKDTMVFFNLEESNLVIHDENRTMVTGIPLVDTRFIMGYDSEIFDAFKLNDEVPRIETGEVLREFNIRTRIDAASTARIHKLISILKTSHIFLVANEHGLFLQTEESHGGSSAILRIEAEPLETREGGKWVPASIDTSNEYPIGLLPAMGQFEKIDVYTCLLEDGFLGQVYLAGEKGGIDKKYVIGPAGRLDDDS